MAKPSSSVQGDEQISSFNTPSTTQLQCKSDSSCLGCYLNHLNLKFAACGEKERAGFYLFICLCCFVHGSLLEHKKSPQYIS